MRRSLSLAVPLLAVLALAPAAAAQGEDACLTTDPPPPTAPAQALRFGITPEVAGSAGLTQGAAAPVDEASAARALQRLRPGRRELVLRLNRLFLSEGDAGIRRFAELADRYAREGLQSEVQIRYHPAPEQEGDIAAWTRFVRAAVRELAARPAVVAFSITNEANFPVSPNTSDGVYDGVLDALVQGTVAAREELVALGRPDLPLGFTVAWRFTPDADARFWREIGARATPAFRAALSYVGLQVYPGLVWPPVPLPGRTPGQEVVEALALVRDCYMPKAGLGDDIALWVSENGYATNLGRSEPVQAASLDSTVREVARYSGELGVTDYRWFNLRDNESGGLDLFDAVGLLRDDYSEKPAFATYRGLIDLFGRDAPAASSAAPPRLRPRLALRVTPARDTRGPRRFTTRGRLAVGAGAPCAGTVTVRYQAGRRTISSRRARVRRDCRFTSRVTFADPRRFAGRRRLTVRVRFAGTRALAPAAARARTVRVR